MNTQENEVVSLEYNGHKFKNQLEASWAVFFDQMNLKYEREEEGYEIEGGVKYFSNFYLSDYKLHVNIVRDLELLSFKEFEKFDIFSRCDDKSVLLICGTPTQEEMYVLDGSYCLDECAYEHDGEEGVYSENGLLDIYKKTALLEKRVIFAKSLDERKLVFVFASDWELRDVNYALSQAQKFPFESNDINKTKAPF
ncbi:MAG: hypothetical protein KDI39_10430 [Pseudomonadales bacterium]|nr:hypothetical protein [Pseudomonadales bacterium]